MLGVLDPHTVWTGEALWQGCWLARSVVVVEVSGYTIEAGADLEGANLQGAGLTMAFLKGADLRRLLVAGGRRLVFRGKCDFTGAIANEDMRWPDGFEPHPGSHYAASAHGWGPVCVS